MSADIEPDRADRLAKAARAADAVVAHVRMMHELAEPYAGRGKLVLAVFGEDPATGERMSPSTLHFEVGDVQHMAAAARAYDQKPNRNVYAGLAAYPLDLRSGAKGTEGDILGVLGLCADLDDAEASRWAERLPIGRIMCSKPAPAAFNAFTCSPTRSRWNRPSGSARP